jgi:peroxiredoxin
MKRIVTCCLLVFLLSELYAQPPNSITLSETSIVKDSTGTIYTYDIWRKLMMTGYYSLKAEEPSNKNTAFVLFRLSDEVREKRMASMPKPGESRFFRTGEVINDFTAKDINGNKYKLKELRGKIVVLNFWFIKCPPCQAEIPELNKLVQHYKDTSIVFLGIALDEKNELTEFLEKTPFEYSIVHNARYLSEQYKISSFPTHVIIDKEGKVYFHTTGLAGNTVYWLEKSIKELFLKP